MRLVLSSSLHAVLCGVELDQEVAEIVRIRDAVNALGESETAALRKMSIGSKSASGIKITFILKDKTDYFYYKLHEQDTAREKFDLLHAMSKKPEYSIKCQIGKGQFKEAVEANSILRDKSRQPKFAELAPRVGYTLATFVF